MRTALAILAVCIGGCGDAAVSLRQPIAPGHAAPHAATISPGERAALDAAIREHLGLPGSAEIGQAELARVTELNLSRTAVSDAAAAWLADPATGLTKLASLNLQYTPVTDVGVAALARADTGLQGLTSLYLAATKITDAGVRSIARADTGLTGLTSLDLGMTAVADAGVADLARAETPLKGLTTLDLSSTKVTDAGSNIWPPKTRASRASRSWAWPAPRSPTPDSRIWRTTTRA